MAAGNWRPEFHLELLTVAQLQPIARLYVDKPPTRKGELATLLAGQIRTSEQLRNLYEQLPAPSQMAVREAVHHPEGRLDPVVFTAKHKARPNFGSDDNPTRLRLLFTGCAVIPAELLAILREFVPPPPGVSIRTSPDLPATAEVSYSSYAFQDGKYTRVTGVKHVALAEFDTETAALQDVVAVLRLVEGGKLGASATTRRPSQAAIQSVAKLLRDGDFYGELPEDTDPDRIQPADREGIVIRPFAWLALVIAAELATVSGSRLQLAPAGQKALAKPPHEAIQLLWKRWLRSTYLDEFNRIPEIKGQGGSKAQMTSVTGRRRPIAEALTHCPVGEWVQLHEFSRFMLASQLTFDVTRNPWALYISDAHYGSLGYQGSNEWHILQGRYIRAFLLEIAATLGMLDVALVLPWEAQRDFGSMWGTDDLRYLSRYDGLCYFRLNALGAWVLGQTASYEPRAVECERVLVVNPNREIVVTGRSLSPVDALFLERFATRTSDSLWKLETERCARAVEDGFSLDELRQFLCDRSSTPVPPAISQLLDDLDRHAAQVKDQGEARLLECADAPLAHLIASDRRLRKACWVAGERMVVYREKDDALVRRVLRELGYPLRPGE